jgi:hypothetical protein
MAQKMSAKEEFLARFTPPPAHVGDAIVEIGGFVVWRKQEDLDGTEGVVFFDGDYRDVLEPDDPRLKGPR